MDTKESQRERTSYLTVELPVKMDQDTKLPLHVSRVKLQIKREYEQFRQYEAALASISQLQDAVRAQEDVIRALKEARPPGSVVFVQRQIRVPEEVVRQKIVTVQKIVQKIKYVPIGYALREGTPQKTVAVDHELADIKKYYAELEANLAKLPAAEEDDIQNIANRPTQKFEDQARLDQRTLLEDNSKLRLQVQRLEQLTRQLEDAQIQAAKRIDEKDEEIERLLGKMKERHELQLPPTIVRRAEVSERKKAATEKGFQPSQPEGAEKSEYSQATEKLMDEREDLRRRMVQILEGSGLNFDQKFDRQEPSTLLEMVGDSVGKLVSLVNEYKESILLDESALKKVKDQNRTILEKLGFGGVSLGDWGSVQQAIAENKAGLPFVPLDLHNRLKAQSTQQKEANDAALRKVLGKYDRLCEQHLKLRNRLDQGKPNQFSKQQLDRLRAQLRQRDIELFHLRGLLAPKGQAERTGEKQLALKIGQCNRLQLKVAGLEEALQRLRGKGEAKQPDQLAAQNEELRAKVRNMEGYLKEGRVKELAWDKDLRRIVGQLEVRLKEEKLMNSQSRSKILQLQQLFRETQLAMGTLASQLLDSTQVPEVQHKLLLQLFQRLAGCRSTRTKVHYGPVDADQVENLLSQLDNKNEQGLVLAALVEQSPAALVHALRRKYQQNKRLQQLSKSEPKEQLYEGLRDRQDYVKFLQEQGEAKDRCIHRLVYEPAIKQSPRVEVQEVEVASRRLEHLRDTSVRVTEHAKEPAARLVGVSSSKLRNRLQRMENSLADIEGRLEPSSKGGRGQGEKEAGRLREHLLRGSLRDSLGELRQALGAKDRQKYRQLVRGMVRQVDSLLQKNS